MKVQIITNNNKLTNFVKVKATYPLDFAPLVSPVSTHWWLVLRLVGNLLLGQIED